MKYEEPKLDVLELYVDDIVRTSSRETTERGDGPDWNV